MEKIYAKVNTVLQQIGGLCPEGWIEMSSERPSGTHIATEEGLWIVDTLRKQASMEEKIQELLDSRARTMNFDNIISGISNASLPEGEYRQADGAALLLWRARVWQRVEQIRDSFLAGQRPEPTWQEVMAELPTYPIN